MSSGLNPVEHIWPWVLRRLEGAVFSGRKQLWTRLRSEFAAAPVSSVKAWYDSRPRRHCRPWWGHADPLVTVSISTMCPSAALAVGCHVCDFFSWVCTGSYVPSGVQVVLSKTDWKKAAGELDPPLRVPFGLSNALA